MDEKPKRAKTLSLWQNELIHALAAQLGLSETQVREHPGFARVNDSIAAVEFTMLLEEQFGPRGEAR
jgi:acyl carrier protein